MSRPMLSNKPTTPTPKKPFLDTSVYARFQDALSLLPQRRSSPTKPSSSAHTTPVKRSSPFSLFSSTRHKPSSSAPEPVQVSTGKGSSSFLGNKAGTLPQHKPLPSLPGQITKSAPASRAATPAATAVPTSTPPPLPAVSSLRNRPTIPFTSSNLLKPTAASSARARPTITSSAGSTISKTPTSGHTRTLSKTRAEPPATPSTPLSPTRSRTVPSPTLDAPKQSPKTDPSTRTSPEPIKISGPYPLRPKPAPRLTTSPPSAFPAKSPPPQRPLARRRSKTFPDPSDPVVPVPPPISPSSSSHAPTLSVSMKTANRIIEAFAPSPRADDTPEPLRATPRSKSTSPTPMSPTRAIRPSQDFMSIPSRARSPGSNRIMPSAASIEANASRPRPTNAISPTRVTHVAASAPPNRSTFDQALQPPPRKPLLSPTLTSSGAAAQSRRTGLPPLQPLQTTPVGRPPSPVTPETQPSSPSPKTPGAYANSYIQEPACVTSDDESRKKRKLRAIFRRPRPDSLVTSSSLTSGSGTSNVASTFGGGAKSVIRSQKGPGTFVGVLEEDEMPMSTQTRHGIRRHAHAAADVPYPISFEEMVLQGERHTQELLSTVLQQKAYHFTSMDNFSKLKSILDVGCGRGYWLSDAVKECKNATLVGFDIVDVFLTQQELRDRRGLNDSQIARIKFRQGNFFDTLPFQSNEFDFIRLAFLELAIPEPKWVPLLKEAWRVLKPGGHIEVVIESQLFPTVWSYDKLPVHQELEDEFRALLTARDIPPATNIGEKMFFDAFARVQTHQHVSVCIAPRPAGRSSLDNPASPRNFGTTRSAHSPWSSEPAMSSGMVSLVPFGRPSLDRSRPSIDVLPPPGHLVTSKTCTVPGLVVSPDVFIPVSEDTLFTYASHGAMILNATRLASFSDKYPDASLDGHEEEWRAHVERYWQYERSNRLRLGFRMKQFEDDDEDEKGPAVGPTTGRWKWSKCDEDLERPLEIRRFRAWSLSKPGGSR